MRQIKDIWDKPGIYGVNQGYMGQTKDIWSKPRIYGVNQGYMR